MSSEYLADYIENAEEELGLLLPAATTGRLDWKGIHKLCDRFRQRGACDFFLTGDPRVFFLNSMQSAGAYSFWLDAQAEAQKVTSEARPFLDAVGCGFWDCAQSIAEHSRMTWNSKREYEDDFLFMQFLMKHFFLRADEREARALIADHERVTEGEDRAHREVCVAFLEQNGSLFDQSLRALLRAREERVEGMVAREAIPEESWSWLRYFSLEGFALLKLADRTGLPTQRDYLHVSESLRSSPSFAFDPDAWRDLKVGSP